MKKLLFLTSLLLSLTIAASESCYKFSKFNQFSNSGEIEITKDGGTQYFRTAPAGLKCFFDVKNRISKEIISSGDINFVLVENKSCEVYTGHMSNDGSYSDKPINQAVNECVRDKLVAKVNRVYFDLRSKRRRECAMAYAGHRYVTMDNCMDGNSGWVELEMSIKEIRLIGRIGRGRLNFHDISEQKYGATVAAHELKQAINQMNDNINLFSNFNMSDSTYRSCFNQLGNVKPVLAFKMDIPGVDRIRRIKCYYDNTEDTSFYKDNKIIDLLKI